MDTFVSCSRVGAFAGLTQENLKVGASVFTHRALGTACRIDLRGSVDGVVLELASHVLLVCSCIFLQRTDLGFWPTSNTGVATVFMVEEEAHTLFTM